MEELSRHCVLVLTQGTTEEVLAMKECLQRTEPQVLIGFQKHVFLPLLSCLQKGKRNEKLISNVYSCIELLLRTIEGRVTDVDTLREIIFSLLVSICSPGAGFHPYVTEDLKIEFVEVFTSLFSVINEDILLSLYTEENKLIFAPLVKLLVDMIEDVCKQLKLKAINALCKLYLSKQQPVAIIFSNFVPGIVYRLTREVLDYHDKSFKIFDAALRGWTDFVTLIFADEDRDFGEEFYLKAVPNLTACAAKVKEVACPPHFKECYPSAKYFASEMLSHCSNTLQGTVTVCLEILLTLEDPHNIRMSGTESLMIKLAEDVSLKQKFFEYFDVLFVKMPRISAVGADWEKQSLIRQLHGLLRLSPITLLAPLDNAISRRRFFYSIFQLMAMDRTHVLVQPDEDHQSTAMYKLVHRQTKSLDMETLRWLEDFGEDFGGAVDFEVCRDFLRENLRDKRFHIEAAFFFGVVCRSLKCPKDQVVDILDDIIEVFPKTQTTPDIIFGAFLLQLLRDLFLKSDTLDACTLVFLLAAAQSDVSLWRVAAEKCLFSIPSAFGFENVEDLLARKAEDICNYLQGIMSDDRPTFHFACRCIFEFIPHSAIEDYELLLRTLVDLLGSGKVHIETLVTLKSLVRCLQTRFPPERLPYILPCEVPLSEYAAKLLEDIRAEERSDKEMDEAMAENLNPEKMAKHTEATDDNGPNSVMDNISIVLPLHAQICKEILDSCVNLQSSSDVWLHTVAFELIADCITSIEVYEDELLPIVHIVWQALVFRLRATDNYALSLKALRVLAILCRTSRSFVRDRIFKELWKQFVTFLQTQRSVSANTRFREYRHTFVYKYQCAVVEYLGDACSQLDLRERHLSPLLEAMVPYLMEKQPDELQTLVSHSVTKFSAVSKDCVVFNVAKAYVSAEGTDCLQCKLATFELNLNQIVEKFPGIALIGL